MTLCQSRVVFLLGSQYQNSLLGQPLFIRRNHFAKDTRARRRRRGVRQWGGGSPGERTRGEAPAWLGWRVQEDRAVLEGAGGQSGAGGCRRTERGIITQRELSSGDCAGRCRRTERCWRVQEDRTGHYHTEGGQLREATAPGLPVTWGSTSSPPAWI